MIISFGNKIAEQIWNAQPSRLPSEVQKRTLLKLFQVDLANNLTDLRTPPSNMLEELKGKHSGIYSLRINLKWRITFRWDNGNAYDVKVEDYHDRL